MPKEAGKKAEPGERREMTPPARPRVVHWPDYEMGFLFFVLATGISFLMYPYFELSNLIMVYLVGVMVTAIRCGRGPAIINSILSVLAFDFFFVPPRFTFEVAETHYIGTFVTMFLVALVISHLTTQIRQQAAAALLQERQTAALHALSRQLAGSRGIEKILEAAVKHISDIFECQAVALLPDEQGKLKAAAGDLASVFQKDILKALSVARWTYKSGQTAGWGTQTLPTTEILYLPLQVAEGTIGVLALRPQNPQRLLTEEQSSLLAALVQQVALPLEVERLEKKTSAAQLAIESERLRTALLSSVTHDLQTPLAAIMGSASSLLELQGRLSPQTAREMLTDIYNEAERLSRSVTSLLDIARLESGSMTLRKEVQPLEEVVGAALNQWERKLAGRPVQVSLPPDLPMVPLDAALAEYIFINLLDNALKYTPPGSPIFISAARKDDSLEVEVADGGPGFPPEDLDKIFDMFYRGSQDAGARGHGLGLSICRAIVEAHGGRIWAENRSAGGAQVRFTLPLQPEDSQPSPEA